MWQIHLIWVPNLKNVTICEKNIIEKCQLFYNLTLIQLSDKILMLV